MIEVSPYILLVTLLTARPQCLRVLPTARASCALARPLCRRAMATPAAAANPPSTPIEVPPRSWLLT